MRDETIIREMQATPGAVVYRQQDETVDVQALKARVAELERELAESKSRIVREAVMANRYANEAGALEGERDEARAQVGELKASIRKAQAEALRWAAENLPYRMNSATELHELADAIERGEVEP